MKLIDKDVLTEKLWERRMKHCDFGGSPYSEYGHEDDEILSLINSLEVKEVDLDGISRHYALNNSPWDDCRDEIQNAYKAGFELGMQVSNKAQKGK